MPSAKYSILSTKPLSREQVQQAATHGIVVSEQAFIEVRPALTGASKKRSREILSNGGVIVFTSPNAVKIIAEIVGTWRPSNNAGEGSNTAAPASPGGAGPSSDSGEQNDAAGLKSTNPSADDLNRRNPVNARSASVYCIEGATREAVSALIPQAHIAGTAAHSKALAELILQDNTITSVAFFCGNIRRDELPDTLHSQGVEVEEIIVYETQETPVKLTETYDGILFYSPSSVRSFFSGNTLPAHTACFAIGHTTGAALRDVTENKVVISPEPAVDALLQTVILYFDNINSQE